MPNRILKDSIWDSSTLAALPDFIEDQFPRWLLLSDDWGCFCADSDSIKGKVYPKRPKVTVKTVEDIRLVFYNAGLLFCWVEGDRLWGFWTNFGEHNYTTSVDGGGDRQKTRRKTPEPPEHLLTAYLAKYGTPRREKVQRAAPWDNLEHLGTSWDKKLNPYSHSDSHSDSDLDPDSDSELIPSESGGVEEEAPMQVTSAEMHETYNRERGPLPECRTLSDSRKAKCRSRIQDRNKDPAGFRQDFLDAIRKARDNPFLSGGGDRGWKVDFDFLVENDTNYVRILEGRYDGKRKSQTEQRSDKNTRAVQDYLGELDAPPGRNDPHEGQRALNAREVKSL